MKKWSIQIEKIKKGRKRIIKSKGIFTPRKIEKKDNKKEETKEKQMFKKENKKRIMFKNTGE